MEFRKHLFLTGEKQTGKSTLLRRLIEARGLAASGFETRLLLIDGQRRGFTLHSLVPIPPMMNDCIISARIAEQRSVPVPETFEENGVLILKNSLAAGAPFVLMDELGKLEQSAPRFCTAVTAVLASSKRVLGVLQKCDSPLVHAIAARDDVTVLQVTPENRDELFQMLLRDFR